MIDPITILTQLQFYKCLQHAVRCVPPVKILLLIIVSVVSLPIDQALTAPLLSTIRQQLEEAKAVPMILACTSTAPQLNMARWA